MRVGGSPAAVTHHLALTEPRELWLQRRPEVRWSSVASEALAPGAAAEITRPSRCLVPA